MKKEMLINVSQPEECRIAIVENGVLEELYVERTSQESYVGNIYKGRIVNIEPSIQAVFVDFGIGRNGFLHVSDVEPTYYRDLEERQGRGRPTGRDRGRHGDQGGRGRERQGRRPPTPLDEFSEFDFDDDVPDAPAATEARPADEVDAGHAPPAGEPAFGGDLADTPAAPPEAAETAGAEERGRGKGRGRGRGKGRGRSDKPEGEVQRPEAEGAAPDASGPPAAADHFPDDEPFHPKFMDSAEHRTSADAPDDDLFFPRGDATETKAEPADTFRREDDAPRNERPERFDDDEPFAEAPSDERFAPADDEPQEEHFPDPDDQPGPVRYETAEDEDEDDFGRRSEPGDEGEDDYPRRSSRDGGRRPSGRFDRRGGPRRGGRPGFGRPKPLIQDIFKRGQEVLVQVIKEGIGTKGPTLSTYISIAGRYLVLMPGLNRIGVSRKITDEEQRRRLREIMSELQPPKGLGFIIRTAGLDRNKKDLQRDLAYLSRLWKVIAGRIRRLRSPVEIYKESDMITRTIRDTFTNEIDTICVDEPTAFEHAKEFLQIVMPRYANRIKLYAENEPLFHKYRIEEEIARIQRRHVPLPNGGSLVIDQTEALVAIDVNSGNFRADNNNAEETAYRMNLIAAKEIARQLRLRDLGGVICNDFIDMRDDKHRRDVERALRDAVKRDRARTKILRISAFGVIEMTRQRIRPSLKRSVYQDCEHCRGTGQVKTCESMSIDVMRMLQLAAHRPNVYRIEIHVAQDVANYLLNKKRREIAKLEEAQNTQVNIIGWSAPPPEAPEVLRRPGGPLPLPHPSSGVSPEMLQFVCYDDNNPPNIVHMFPHEDAPRDRRR